MFDSSFEKHIIEMSNEINIAILVRLKWCYDRKITVIVSLDFETMFTKHSPSEILSLNFQKKTVYLNCNFPF